MVGEKGKLESGKWDRGRRRRQDGGVGKSQNTHLLQSWTKLQSVLILAGLLPTELKSQSSL